ncbi:MAG: diaminopimelate decarboxylase [Chloroflexota bacterium]
MTTDIPARDLLPVTADAGPQGRLMLGGRDAAGLLEEFGSPLYVFDEDTVRAMCRAYTGAFQDAYPGTHISYSAKAFIHPTLARILHEEGVGIDVVSGGELAVAKVARFPASELNFHGNNKSQRELREAVEYGIGLITVDSRHEIDALDQVAASLGKKQPVMLRVSPSIDGHTHRLTSTGVLDSKFGFSIETGQAEEAVREALARPNLDVRGIHFHLGSPIFELEPYEEATHYVLEFAARMRAHGLAMSVFSPGGGFALGYVEDQQPPPVSAYAGAIAGAVRQGCDAHGLPEPRLIVEPGRSLVGRAGVALYTVGAVKEIPGVRTYVSVDGGMGDNIRPALYDAGYTAVKANDISSSHDQKVTVAGKYCESGDILVKDAKLPPVGPGDVIAVAASGAYCVPMASNYNLNPRPGIVMVRDGEASLLRRQETYEDMLATSIY